MRTIKGTSVCVIGGAGFLGSHLVNHLVDDRQCYVLVVDNLCVGRREYIHKDAVFVHHDITTSEEHLVQLFKEHDIRYVFNYAAWPYIPDSFQRPLQVFSVNAVGAIKVINAAQTAGCDGTLQVSSAELYGEQRRKIGFDKMVDHLDEKHGFPVDNKLNESALVLPHSTYGAAKAAVDYYCQSAWRERKTRVVVLRQFNCIGERETHPYVLPEILSQLSGQKSDPIVHLGNNSVRDFLYAGDAVRMAVELLEKGGFGQVYNMGSEEGVRIYELANMVSKIWTGLEVQVVVAEHKKRPWEIWHLQSDNSKIYSTIEARPKVSLIEGLEKTVDYFERNNCKWDWNMKGVMDAALSDARA